MTPSLGSPGSGGCKSICQALWVGAIGNGSQIIVRDSNENQDGWSYVIVKSGAPLVPSRPIVQRQHALSVAQSGSKPLQIDAQYTAE